MRYTSVSYPYSLIPTPYSRTTPRALENCYSNPCRLESMLGISPGTSPSKPCVKLSPHTAPRFSQPFGLSFDLLQ
ncbi:MAG: hypothetical protein F6J90_03715 [Moorea sp. SIOASIH]|uniref:hypothetical protein n=1 Tax=Moorena sp. SIOASIH TaxID=2607817 RepID=UPI0013BB7923|nr:hypothetical protein [Moorena sp. SIOASIH]NEO35466.1 hypothetical protein [Moorena sp. SIOASIH]